MYRKQNNQLSIYKAHYRFKTAYFHPTISGKACRIIRPDIRQENQIRPNFYVSTSYLRPGETGPSVGALAGGPRGPQVDDGRQNAHNTPPFTLGQSKNRNEIIQ